MKLLGVVVLFYPKADVWSNIETYISGVDNLILWCNSPIEINPFPQEKVIIMGDGENIGLGKALNEAVLYGINNGYTHLLTMDQDSSFMYNSFFDYKFGVENCVNRSIFLFSPEIYDDYSKDLAIDDVDNISVAITSGSIFNIEVFKKVGFFKDDFFIDAIDVEFSFRIKAHGLGIGRLKKGKLKHCLGNRISVPFLWGQLVSLNYSPIRTYYIIRNHIVIKRMYPDFQIYDFFKEMFFRRLVRIILIEKDKMLKIKLLYLGLYHGFINKLGKYDLL